MGKDYKLIRKLRSYQGRNGQQVFTRVRFSGGRDFDVHNTEIIGWMENKKVKLDETKSDKWFKIILANKQDHAWSTVPGEQTMK